MKKPKDALDELKNYLDAQEKKITKLEWALANSLRALEKAKQGIYDFDQAYNLDRQDWTKLLMVPV